MPDKFPRCFRLFAAVLTSLLTIVVSGQQAYAGGVGAWTLADVGSPPIRGAASELACAASTGCPLFSVSGGGLGVAGTTDQFAFLYQKLTGDGVVTMRLQSLNGTAMAEAGLMMRESLDATGRHASILSGGSGVFSRSRVASGGNTASISVSKGSWWLRLERVGQVVTASVSNDGSLWNIVATQTLSLPGTIYAGIVVTSRAPASGATANVSNMSLSSTAPTLPSGWTAADVGTARATGTTSYSNGVFIGSSSGTGVASTADAFRFVYARVRGDAKLSARVVAAQGPAGRLAGIFLRTTLDAGAEEAALVVDETGLILVRRAAAGQTVSKTRLVATVVPVFLQLNRTGSMLSVAYSTDGTTWKALANLTVAFGSELYAGVGVAAGPGGALASGPFGGLAAAAFDRLSLVSVAANAPPVVSLVTPSSGNVFTEGQSIAMTANASDPDDLVAGVDFRVNGVKIASDTVAPYSATWTPGAAGVYSVVAAASDFDGAVTTSAPALITVAPKASLPPPSGGSGSGSGSGSNASVPDLPVPTGPWRLQFTPSADDATVTGYTMEIAIAYTQAIKVSKNIGKPSIGIDGTCLVDIDGIVSALPVGAYEVVVKAVGVKGVSASYAYWFSR